MRYLLLPISFLYQLVLIIRHKLFDMGLMPSKSFNIPIICIGNLCLGGSGKTPHTEYLIRLLSQNNQVGVLSRGYGRKTKGFRWAEQNSTFEDIGDEPLQYKQKFNNIAVAVDEDRVEGIEKMMHDNKSLDLFLLDDAFQHRKIKPGFNILLTDFHNIYPKDHLVPTGTLRDIKSAAKRADIIVVTKTPQFFSPYLIKDLENAIRPKAGQKLFFSYLTYDDFTPMNEVAKATNAKEISRILLFCGIANPYPLQHHLKPLCNELSLIQFPDHHAFSESDLDKILSEYDRLLGRHKCIITTEKDAMRLINSPYFSKLNKVPLFYVSVRVQFHNTGTPTFDEKIIRYVTESKRNSTIY